MNPQPQPPTVESNLRLGGSNASIQVEEEDTRAWRRGDQLDVSRLTKPLFVISMGSEMIDVLHQRLAAMVRRPVACVHRFGPPPSWPSPRASRLDSPHQHTFTGTIVLES